LDTPALGLLSSQLENETKLDYSSIDRHCSNGLGTVKEQLAGRTIYENTPFIVYLPN
jgi:hypothetical protein